MKNYHLCKEDYGEVKQRLSMRQVAEHYGCKVTRDGTCLCPFHNDTHPSMKIYPDDKGFYCWVCQKGGDVIKFVALLYGLKNEEACKRLIDDFLFRSVWKACLLKNRGNGRSSGSVKRS